MVGRVTDDSNAGNECVIIPSVIFGSYLHSFLSDDGYFIRSPRQRMEIAAALVLFYAISARQFF